MNGSARARGSAARRRGRHDRRADHHRQDDRGVRAVAALGAHVHLVPAQGHRQDAEPDRARPRRSVRAAPEPGRRHQAVLQGAVGAEHRRPAHLPDRAVPRGPPGLPGLQHRAHRRRGHHRRPRDVPPARRPPVRDPVAARDVGHRPLRRAARGLVVGLEVPAPRFGACVGPAPQLRSRLRPRHRRRARTVEHAVDPRHRDPAGLGRLPVDLQRRLVLAAGDRRARDLRHLGGRRDQSPPVRPRRGGTGAHRRLLHRVHGHQVRDLLPRGVHERHHDVRDRGDAVLRRAQRSRTRLPPRQRLVQRLGDARLLVHVQGHRAAVRHRVVARVPPAPALRPAHGSRLEVPHRDRLHLGDDLGRGGRRQGGGLVDVDRPPRRHRRRSGRAVRRCPSATKSSGNPMPSDRPNERDPPKQRPRARSG